MISTVTTFQDQWLL